MNLSIVLPALNEEQSIGKVIKEIPIKELKTIGFDTEVIVIDNGSHDKTSLIARKYGAIVIFQPKRGYGNAYKAGFANAHGDIIVTADADLSYSFEKLPEIIKKMQNEKLDFISTDRLSTLSHESMHRSHIWGNYVLSLTTRKLFHWPYKDSQSGMWIFKRKIWKHLDVRATGMPFSQEIKIEAYIRGYRCAEIPIKYRARTGKVKLHSIRDGVGNIAHLFSKRLQIGDKSLNKGQIFNEEKIVNNLNKRKIALVYDAIYPYIKGGAEHRYYEIGKRLSTQGYEIHLYGMKLWEGPKTIEKDGLILHGIAKERPLYTTSGRRSIKQAVIFGLCSFKLIIADFDVIDCSGFPFFSIFPAKLASKIKRKPLYATWHEVWGKKYWNEYLGKLGSIGYIVERLAVRMPDVLIAASTQTADALSQTLKVSQPIHTIESGIDISHIQNLTAYPSTVDIVYIGRLVAHKNVDYILKAVAEIKKRRPNIQCRIIGEGPERKKLETLATDLCIKDDVSFIDFQEKHDDALSLMKAGKVFVLPSTREGFGLVALEANAVGLPVVTVNAPANATCKLIEKNNGVITNLSVRDLTRGIEKALSGEFLPEECTYSAMKYDWSNIMFKIEAILS